VGDKCGNKEDILGSKSNNNWTIFSPASGVCTNLAIAALLVLDCHNKFAQMCSNNELSSLVGTWEKDRRWRSKNFFVNRDGIDHTTIVERRQLKPLMQQKKQGMILELVKRIN